MVLNLNIRNLLDTAAPYDPRYAVGGFNSRLHNGSGAISARRPPTRSKSYRGRRHTRRRTRPPASPGGFFMESRFLQPLLSQGLYIHSRKTICMSSERLITLLSGRNCFNELTLYFRDDFITCLVNEDWQDSRFGHEPIDVNSREDITA
jgi:hypothetical protein